MGPVRFCVDRLIDAYVGPEVDVFGAGFVTTPTILNTYISSVADYGYPCSAIISVVGSISTITPVIVATIVVTSRTGYPMSVSGIINSVRVSRITYPMIVCFECITLYCRY